MSALSARPGLQRAAGVGLGVLADAAFGDPRRGHPVALFGRYATALEARLYGPSRRRGVLFTAAAVGLPVACGLAAERASRQRPLLRVGLVGLATWASLGGTSLAAEGQLMAGALGRGDVPAARARLSHLCARDPAGMGAEDLARATVESLAENSSDAAVAPLFWAAVGGVPGVVGYRAVNTLDAMVGYRSPRYDRFGWASARLDDLANVVPARLTAALSVLVAPAVGGSRASAWQVLRSDGGSHPSPNAGPVEAAAAGALGVRLGGTNVYAGTVETRPVMGSQGRAPAVSDIDRAVVLGRLVARSAAGASVLAALLLGSPRGRRR